MNQIKDFTRDAEEWGSALNEAAWKFIDVCPEKSATLFNTCKGALREAILVYASKITLLPTTLPVATEAGRLLPCPFCGASDVEAYPADRERNLWNVCCGNPGCVTCGDNDYLSEAAAVAAWNRRAAIIAEPGDAVSWECRVVFVAGGFGEWEKCTRDMYDTIKTTGLYNGNGAPCEARELFTHPAAPVGVSEVSFWRDAYERTAFQLYRSKGHAQMAAQEMAQADFESRVRELALLQEPRK